MMQRRHNIQTISWFWDIHQRQLLNLDPPYQRRSVWNQSYKNSFVETILLGYPAPAVFLYEDMQPSGRALYNVVDGKQRLVTIFEFAADIFPVGEKCPIGALRGLYFRDLPDDAKRAFWSYQFLVEYLPTDAENVINDIFDRINKNVAKLTPQELRHARFSGVFIQTCEQLAEWMAGETPEFPRIVTQSRNQMKDVQLVAELLLLAEKGPRSYSQDELDDAFAARDDQWEDKARVERAFRAAIAYTKALISANDDIRGSRLRNQIDYYSLIGAILELQGTDAAKPASDVATLLANFAHEVDSDESRGQRADAQAYYDAARSAASDTSNRRARIDLLAKIMR